MRQERRYVGRWVGNIYVLLYWCTGCTAVLLYTHGGWVRGLSVGGWYCCCTAVLLLYCTAVLVYMVRACLMLFRRGWNGWNGTRLLVVVRSIPSCLCPFRISSQPINRPEQKITQLTFAAGPRSSTRRQGCRHVGSECS